MKLAELTFQSGEITEPIATGDRDALLDELDGWSLEGKMIARTFTFDNFVQALEFVNRVGDLAEEYQHHPEILLEYGKATVKWWTHTANGVAANDFLLARETSQRFTA